MDIVLDVPDYPAYDWARMNQSKSLKVVIVGGGFAGVKTALILSHYDQVSVTLISAADNFSYFPQLYHSATGGIMAESAIPLDELLGGTSVELVKDTITTFAPDKHLVTGSSKSYSYDRLVLAMGAVTNYFGIQGLDEFSYDIKSPAGADRFKRHLHKQLIEDKKTDTNYVIVGGGPTGVELSAALGDYLHRITKLHGMKKPKYHIDLVEAAPRILPRSPENMSVRVTKRLEALGVTVMAGATVKAETADQLQLAGESLRTKTVVWTAGVSNNPFFKANAEHFTLEKNGKVHVDDHLFGAKDVYVVGDNAFTQYSGMAQTALHDAVYVSVDILAHVGGKAHGPYKAAKPISVIPVGAHYSAAEWGPVTFYGYPGYILRRLADLVGYLDIESVPRAIKLWLSDSKREDECPICSPREQSQPVTSPAN